jgi:uncharacterized protein
MSWKYLVMPCHDGRGWGRQFTPHAALLFLLAFLTGLFTGASAFADPPIPALTGRVVDEAGILDQGTIANLTAQLAGYEQSTTNQVVVVTLPDLKGYPIEDWGLALGRGWDIGQKGKDNGVLLIVAPNAHKVRIEVGYGLEGDLPDATANQIIQSEIIPKFKSGDMAGGISAGVSGILAALGGTYTPSAQSISGDDSDISTAFNGAAPFALLVFFGIAVLMSRIRRRWDPTRKRRVWYWGPALYGAGLASSQSGFSSGFGGGGGFSGGGFSGGGFSGGGGGFGGGGASGGW